MTRREEMALSVIEDALSKAHAARVYGVSAKIVARWVERYRPKAGLVWWTVPRGLPICHGPPLRGSPSGPCDGNVGRASTSANEVASSPATVSRVLKRPSFLIAMWIMSPGLSRSWRRTGFAGSISFSCDSPARFERVGHRITGSREGQSNIETKGRRMG
jgi:hypothetical protein